MTSYDDGSIPVVDASHEVLRRDELPWRTGEHVDDERTVHLLEDHDGVQLTIYPKRSCFHTVKLFHPSGAIRKKWVLFNHGMFISGRSFAFAADGTLIEAIDHDAGYDFAFADLRALVRGRGIVLSVGYEQFTGFHTHIWKQRAAMDATLWRVQWLKRPDLIGGLTIDGRTGAILASDETPFANE